MQKLRVWGWFIGREVGSLVLDYSVKW
jgi:hypothetical protein